MDEAEPQKQTRMVTKSSINRKPLADTTNIVRKPYHTSSLFQSKKPVSSTASDSSIGSTQNPINVHRPIVIPPDQPFPFKTQKLTADHLVGVENQTAQAQRHGSRDTRSKTTAAVPFYQASTQGRKNNAKEGSVSLCSSTLNKNKDQGKTNRSCLDKTVDDVKKISVSPHNSSTEKIKEKRKPVYSTLSAQLMKNANNSADKNKGKENVQQSGYSLAGNAECNTGLTNPDSLMKRKDKGKAIAVPLDYPSRKKLKNSIMEFGVPLKGVILKEREEMVMGSGSVNPVQKDKEKGVFTPINYHTLEKKDQQRSCPPVLRTMSNRSAADGKEDTLQSKLQTEPPPKKKKRRYHATKDVNDEYTLPKEFVERQRAYFKEIDDFELQVEEV